jgi:hypothetical protein
MHVFAHRPFSQHALNLIENAGLLPIYGARRNGVRERNLAVLALRRLVLRQVRAHVTRQPGYEDELEPASTETLDTVRFASSAK